MNSDFANNLYRIDVYLYTFEYPHWMSKATVTCPSCNEDNDPNSEFCINCGSKLMEPQKTSGIIEGEEDDWEQQFLNWKKSVPYTSAAIVFLMFIDWVTGSGLDWFYWAAVPIFLFAILAPYLSFKIK